MVSLLERASAGAPVSSLERRWLGRIDYREAWALQKDLLAQRADGTITDQMLLLEHAAVITLGRHADPDQVLAPPDELSALGIETIRVERGGEATYHGPGQLVAYPIVKLADRAMLVRPFVRALEGAMVDTCAAYGIHATRRDGYPGCWLDPDGPRVRKIGALGVRVERGVSYHGIALNVTTDLSDYRLLDPCGMPGLAVTSIAVERGEGDRPATTASVEAAAVVFADALERRLSDAAHGST